MNTLMLIVLLCVPLMLCVKPCYINCTMNKKVDHEDEFHRVNSDETPRGGDYATHDDNFVEAA